MDHGCQSRVIAQRDELQRRLEKSEARNVRILALLASFISRNAELLAAANLVVKGSSFYDDLHEVAPRKPLNFLRWAIAKCEGGAK